MFWKENMKLKRTNEGNKKQGNDNIQVDTSPGVYVIDFQLLHWALTGGFSHLALP